MVYTKYDYLRRVKTDFSFDVVTSISTNKIEDLCKIKDANDIFPRNSLEKTKSGYRILAPKNGYVPGQMYLVELKNNVKFSDPNFTEKKELMFDVVKDEIFKYDYTENVDISIAPKEIGKFEDKILSFDSVVSSEYFTFGKIQLFDIIDDDKLPKQIYYQVDSIYYSNNRTFCVGKSPTIEEIFEDIEIYGDIDFNKVDPIFINEELLLSELRESSFYDAFLEITTLISENYEEYFFKDNESYNNSEEIQRNKAYEDVPHKKELNIKVKSRKIGSAVEIEVKFEAVNLIKIKKMWDNTYINFFITLVFNLEIGADVNIKLLDGIAAMAMDMKSEVSAKFEAELISYVVDKESTKSTIKLAPSIEETMFLGNPTPENIDITIETLPIQIAPGLQLKITPKSKQKLTFRASGSASFTFKNHFSMLVGIFGYESKSFLRNEIEAVFKGISVVGSMEYKLGAAINISLVIAGVFYLGGEGEIGLYARAAGGFSFTTGDWSKEFPLCFYVEGGLYFELASVVELDLKVKKFNFSYKWLDYELTFFRFGYSKIRKINQDPETITLIDSNTSPIPDIYVTVLDMFTHEETTEIIHSSRFNDVFNYKIVSDNDTKLRINHGNLIIDSSKEDFDAAIDISYKLKTQNIIDFAVVEIELGNIGCTSTITVVKEPIKIKSVSTKYQLIDDDPEYEKLYQLDQSTPYVNNEKYGDKDFQVSRLIKVIPEVTPSNASYKTFQITPILGTEHIEYTIDQPRLIEENGLSFFIFRIKDGNEHVGKMINFSITSDGYKGKYSEWNIIVVGAPLTTTMIPALDGSVLPKVETSDGVFATIKNSYQNQVNEFKATKNSVFRFEIHKPDLFPANASTGVIGEEDIEISTDNAVVIDKEKLEIQIKDSAIIGSQVKIRYKLGKLILETYIEVSKNALYDLELIQEKETMINGQENIISTVSTTIFGDLPTYSKVDYHYVKGDNISNLELKDNYSILTLNDKAKYLDEIQLIAMQDGIFSNIITILVDKIEPESLSISTTSDLLIHKGDKIEIHSEVLPLNSTNHNVVYEIIEDNNQISTIDSISGVLSIKLNAKYQDVVKVRAKLEGLTSEIITFTVPKMPVRYLYYGYYEINLYEGDVFDLDTYLVINQDATVKDVTYALSQDDYATLEGSILTINSSLPGDDLDFAVSITSVDDPSKVYYIGVLLHPNPRNYNLPYDFRLIQKEGIDDIAAGQCTELELEFNSASTSPAGVHIINTQVEFSVTGSADIIDISHYSSPNNFRLEGPSKILVRARNEALPRETITVIASYKGFSSSYILTVTTGVKDIILEQNKTRFKRGDSYQFSAIPVPSNIALPNVRYDLNVTNYLNYISLTRDGYMEVKYFNEPFTEKEITISISFGEQIRYFNIIIYNEIISILLEPSNSIHTSKDMESITYFEGQDFYLVNSQSVFYIRRTIIADSVLFESELNFNYILDSNSLEYFNFDPILLSLTPKGIKLPGGLFANLFLEINGVFSNVLKFYIPKSIFTIGDFKEISNNVFDCYYLANDLDFNEENIYIDEFDGIFDGGNHSIFNFSLQLNESSGNFGLFRVNKGIILNLSIRKTKINIFDRAMNDGLILYAGSIAGENYGTIDNCLVSSDTTVKYWLYATNLIFGGLVGINKGILSNSSCYPGIKGFNATVGGLVGHNLEINGVTSGIIKNCNYFGYIDLIDCARTTGLVGKQQGKIQNSYIYNKPNVINR